MIFSYSLIFTRTKPKKYRATPLIYIIYRGERGSRTTPGGSWYHVTRSSQAVRRRGKLLARRGVRAAQADGGADAQGGAVREHAQERVRDERGEEV